MNKKKFNSLLSNPSKITEADLLQLEEMQKEYSYSQVIHALIARSHYKLATPSSPQKVGFAAMHSADRKVLKAYLDDIAIAAPKKTEKEQAPSAKKSSERTKTSPAKPVATPVAKPNVEKRPIEAMVKEPLPASTKAGEPTKSSVPDTGITAKSETKKTATTKKTETAEVPERSMRSEIEKIREEILANLELLGKNKGAFNADSSEKKSPKKKAAKLAPDNKPQEQIANKLVEEINTLKEKPIGKKQAKQNQLIEEFIEKKPRIRTPEIDPESPDKETMDLARESVSFGDDLVSENLALIFVQQGKKAKAIDIYKKLIWKYPQKKTYFAGQIKALQKK